ncbi:MAG: alpha/beta fold hydrolase [Thermoguttaceae bacterium]
MSRRVPTLCWLAFGLGLMGGMPGRAAAQEAVVEPCPLPRGDAVPAPTLGGMQFWADELFFHDWRIQRNVVTGHCRLLDGSAFRHAWGTYEECLAALDEVKRRQNLPPMQGKAVVLLHGLGDSRLAMAGLAKYLKEQGGYQVFNVSYPSTRGCMADYARSLTNILQNLSGIEEINFVGHSMGNIVIRRYLGEQTDPRIKRFVMLGPPNRGSSFATALADNPVFTAVLGKPGQELGREWAWLEGRLATPSCEFGIIAGGLGNSHGFNPFLSGDDDGIVSVESTRLDGAKGFVMVPVLHGLLMHDRRVQAYTLRFLRNGKFQENAEGRMQNAE